MELNGRPETREDNKPEPVVPEESLAYARVIAPGVVATLTLLVATFAIYVSGAGQADVPPEKMQKLWSKPCAEYRRTVGIDAGWAWVRHADKADYTNYLGICLLAGLVALGYLCILPVFLRKRQWPLALIALAQLLVLLVAASGVLLAGR